MHTINLNIDDSIYEKFMGLLDILPKDKISISDSDDLISFAQAQKKVQIALNELSKNKGIELDKAFEQVINS